MASQGSSVAHTLGVIVANSKGVNPLTVLQAYRPKRKRHGQEFSDLLREYRRSLYMVTPFVWYQMNTCAVGETIVRETTERCLPSFIDSNFDAVLKNLSIMLAAVFTVPHRECRSVLDDMAAVRQEIEDTMYIWEPTRHLPESTLGRRNDQHDVRVVATVRAVLSHVDAYVNACGHLVQVVETICALQEVSGGELPVYGEIFGMCDGGLEGRSLRLHAMRSFLMGYVPMNRIASCTQPDSPEEELNEVAEMDILEDFVRGRVERASPVNLDIIERVQRTMFMSMLSAKICFDGALTVVYNSWPEEEEEEPCDGHTRVDVDVEEFGSKVRFVDAPSIRGTQLENASIAIRFGDYVFGEQPVSKQFCSISHGYGDSLVTFRAELETVDGSESRRIDVFGIRFFRDSFLSFTLGFMGPGDDDADYEIHATPHPGLVRLCASALV